MKKISQTLDAFYAIFGEYGEYLESPLNCFSGVFKRLCILSSLFRTVVLNIFFAVLIGNLNDQ